MKKVGSINSFPLAIKIIFILLLVLYFVFFLFGQELIEDIYSGSAPEFISKIVTFIYPRFESAKNRFTVEFFIEKANQVFIRSFFVLIIAALIFYLDQKKSVFINYFSGECSTFQINFLRVVFYLSMLFYTADWYVYLNDYHSVTRFYEPIFIYKILQIRYPNKLFIQVLWVVYIMSLILLICDIKSFYNSIIVLILFTLIQGYFYSFGKINHAYATYGYVAFVMPFLLFDNQKSRLEKKAFQNSWALKLIQVCLAISYFFAGLEKIFISNFSWVGSNTLRSYLVFYQDKAIFNHTNFAFLIDIMPALVLLFQVGFILILFYPLMKWLFLPVGIIFHISIFLFTGIGALIHPWFVLYIYFIDWYKIKNLVSKILPGSSV